MEYRPHPYQEYCKRQIIEKPYIALMLEMGLGKSVITLSALKELKYYRFEICRTLIIAPKKVAEDTWQCEAEKWDHLNCLSFSTVLGSEKERNEALRQDADIYVINRENVLWLVSKCVKEKRWPFDTVVLDESSSFKNWQAKRFKALKAVRSKISRLIELTGTPSPNGLMDLWAQLYLLDGGERLGRTISVYRDSFFTPGARNGMTVFEYKPRKNADKEIYSRISDICISMKAEDYLDLPEIVYETIPVKLDKTSQEKYKQLEKEAVLEIGGDTVTAATAAALTGKLLQLCNGAVYGENETVVQVHDCKIEALMETLEQLNGEHAIICYYFRHDLERIKTVLSKTVFRFRQYTDASDKEAWNKGEIDLMLIHPSSCGYGLNLQTGGRHIIWFGLTWNLEQYQQANCRLYRQGQTKPVIVHHLVVKGGMDEAVISSLHGKEDVQDSLLRALKARIDEVREG